MSYMVGIGPAAAVNELHGGHRACCKEGNNPVLDLKKWTTGKEKWFNSANAFQN